MLLPRVDYRGREGEGGGLTRIKGDERTWNQAKVVGAGLTCMTRGVHFLARAGKGDGSLSRGGHAGHQYSRERTALRKKENVLERNTVRVASQRTHHLGKLECRTEEGRRVGLFCSLKKRWKRITRLACNTRQGAGHRETTRTLGERCDFLLQRKRVFRWSGR